MRGTCGVCSFETDSTPLFVEHMSTHHYFTGTQLLRTVFPDDYSEVRRGLRP
jgi:hypothetical protein